jgi:uncharacterized protein (DUF58 family)
MEKKKSFNTDIPSRIAELQAAMKEFILRHRLYRILLRGKGLEFETFRKYAPDDDASSIDWKASMRSNSLLVKQYRDERNLKVIFVVDVGDNMVFGSSEKLKCEFAAEIVSAFSHLIITTGDRVGAIFFSDEVQDYMGPTSGLRHFNILVDKLTSPETYGKPSNLDVGLNFVLNYIRKNIDSIIVVSDFTTFSDESIKNLSLIAGKFETVALMVRDPLDRTLPDITGQLVIEDPKSGEQLLIDPKIAKSTYEKLAHEQEEIVRKTCEKNNIDFLELTTNKPFVVSLSEFLKSRLKKRDRQIK